ncbi:MAG TPA: hypothetical protein VGH73_12960 [Thermoanaerobaculia bacterium]|jgi:hypothetical protein
MHNPFNPEDVSELENLVLPEISEEDLVTVFGGTSSVPIVPTCGC